MPQEFHGRLRPDGPRRHPVAPLVSRRCFAALAAVLLAMVATISNAGCTGDPDSRQAEPAASVEESTASTNAPAVVLTPVSSPAPTSENIQKPTTASALTNMPELPPAVLQPTRTPPPQPAGTPLPELSADEIYKRVAPSVAMVVSSVGWGSGVLLEGSYLVTNHHVYGRIVGCGLCCLTDRISGGFPLWPWTLWRMLPCWVRWKPRRRV